MEKPALAADCSGLHRSAISYEYDLWGTSTRPIAAVDVSLSAQGGNGICFS